MQRKPQVTQSESFGVALSHPGIFRDTYGCIPWVFGGLFWDSDKMGYK